MDMSKETEQKIGQLQLMEQNMQQFLSQKQTLQAQLSELDSALEELKSSENSYRIVGNIMVKVEKAKLTKDLTSKKEVAELRLRRGGGAVEAQRAQADVDARARPHALDLDLALQDVLLEVIDHVVAVVVEPVADLLGGVARVAVDPAHVRVAGLEAGAGAEVVGVVAGALLAHRVGHAGAAPGHRYAALHAIADVGAGEAVRARLVVQVAGLHADLTNAGSGWPAFVSGIAGARKHRHAIPLRRQ